MYNESGIRWEDNRVGADNGAIRPSARGLENEPFSEPKFRKRVSLLASKMKELLRLKTSSLFHTTWTFSANLVVLHQSMFHYVVNFERQNVLLKLL
jgi:hypothetical protein